MQTKIPPVALFNIKVRIAGQRIIFSAPYSNRAEAFNRIMDWLEQYLGDSLSPIIFIIQPARPY